MDERDSPTSLAAAVAASGREGSIDEDGGILSVTAGLAKDAALLFQARRFTECIDLLNQLLQKKEDDPKVLHNIAVAEYFRDGCSDPRKLLDVFNKVKKKSEDLDRASGEKVEVVTGNLGSNVISGSKGSGTSLHQFSAANTASIAYADEFDTSIVTLNTAVVLYHLHDYSHARSILEQLYRNIEPIDETTALHVCLLLLDIALASRDASKAADVILYLEKAFGVGYMTSQGDGSVTQDLPSNHTSKFSASPSSSAVPDATSSDASASANASENQLVRTLSDDALDYETLLSTLDIGGQNSARPASNDLSRIMIDKPTPAIDLKLKLHLYKVRFLLLTRNLKAAKREVKLAMNIARGRDSSTALLLKSQLEYARGNHRKAVKLLMTSSSRTEAGIVSMFNNNLGCINHRLRKHHLSSVFFSKALRSSSLLRSEKPLKLSTFSQDKSMLIIYNCGLQYLACGRPLDAARCFHKASPVFYKQPLLWLRFAECCLLAQEKGLLKSTKGDPSSDGEDVRLKVLGSGKWRQLVVDVNSRNMHLDSTVENGLFSGNDSYRLSISFARTCLNNALHLLIGLEQEYSKAITSVATLLQDDSSNQTASLGIKNPNPKSIPSGGDSKASNAPSVPVVASANGDSKEAKGGLSSNTTFQSSVSAYEDMCRKENNMLKQAVLADLAYVELSLENPLKALSVAKALVQLPECSRLYIFLSHVYSAEALCHLNRPKEAAEQLSVYISDGGSNVKLPYSDEDRKKWWGVVEKCGDEELNASSGSAQTTTTEEQRQGIIASLSPEEARGALYINLAAISAMQADLEQASQFVTAALSAQPDNPRALLAAVYVELRLGKMQDALVKLRRCAHVRFIPGNVTSSSS